MTEMDRRKFLAGLGASMAAVPMLSSKTMRNALSNRAFPDSLSARSLGTVNLQLTWLKDQTFLGEYQAAAKGYWANRGLSVNMIAGGGSIDPLVPVVAGKAFTSAPSASEVGAAIDKGAYLTIFATSTQEQPSAITSLASKPIASPKAMVGKTIGVNESTTVTFNAFLASNSITPSQVKVIPYNYDTSILTDGSCDALFTYSYDEPVALAEAGVKTHTFLMSDYNYNVINNAWTVQSSVLKNTHQRAQLVALMAGLVEGWAGVIANPKGTIPGLLNTYSHELAIKPSLGIATQAATTPLILGKGSIKNIFKLTPGLIDSTIEGLARQKVKLTKANFDTSIMEHVVG